MAPTPLRCRIKEGQKRSTLVIAVASFSSAGETVFFVDTRFAEVEAYREVPYVAG